MTQTNTKYRLHTAGDQGPEMLDSGDTGLGITRTVAQEESIIVVRVEGVVPGYNVHPGSPGHQTPDLILLETTVHCTDPGTATHIDSLH